MMLDFIYDKPEVDFVFCMENQLDLFKGNQLFSNTAKKMGAALPGQNVRTVPSKSLMHL